MEYIFKDRQDLESVPTLREKLQACADMIAIYGETFGVPRDSITPDSVTIATGVSARALQCLFTKNGVTLYILAFTHMYGFGATFCCVSDMHDAAIRAMAYAANSGKRPRKKKSIKLGGAE